MQSKIIIVHGSVLLIICEFFVEVEAMTEIKEKEEEILGLEVLGGNLEKFLGYSGVGT